MLTQEKSPNFYINIPSNISSNNSYFFEKLEEISDNKNTPIYIIDKPLTDRKYNYKTNGSFIILIPKHKIIFLKNNDELNFENFILDFLEDAASLADRYNYIDNLGRARTWREKYIYEEKDNIHNIDISLLLEKTKIKDDDYLSWQCEQLLSLLLGSINDIQRVGNSPAETILDKVKKKIILFDAEQTRFIFQESNPKSKTTRIQGLSGTGKTELLLHKIKELYTRSDSPKIALSCHNKVLADSLRDRIPEFFDFMKIDQQIKWGEKLFCFHAWGSKYEKASGLYKYICDFYEIPFLSYSRNTTFGKVCKIAYEHIVKKIETLKNDNIFAFDFILLDESQDFPDEFFELCKLVVKHKLYIAGDIFQSIFDNNILSGSAPDYLLNKCYRTDPRTLMLSHSIGMGLFEKNKIRWLSEEEWNACGYIYEQKQDKYSLHREPLRRFEDIESPSFDVSFINFNKEIVTSYIIDKIISIKTNHPTVKPEDICIVFPIGNDIYDYVDYIQSAIKERLGYYINKAYESKESKRENTIFVSNRNNVKGLEFAFVICVVPYLSKSRDKTNLIDRNAIYMALTRSYLQSFLLLNSDHSYIKENKDNIKLGSEKIINNGYIEGIIPTSEEINEIHEELNALKSKPVITLSDVLNRLFNELEISHQYRAEIGNMIQLRVKNKEWNEDTIRMLINAELHMQMELQL